MQVPWTQTADDNRPFLIVSVALIVLAWIALLVWGMSPWARYLSHDAVDLILHGSGVWVAGLFVGGWTLMVIAMMLPASLPLILLFRRMTVRHADRGILLGMLIGGYLVVWVAFGVAVHAADLGIHQVAAATTFLTAHPWVLVAGIFAVAGGYQFTEMKYRCLDKCRSPMSFITSYWRGSAEWRNSLTLGIHHGIFCVGCCWSLMLLMFAVGHGNLGWMLVLGVVMGAEKNLKKGRALAKPLGIGLLIGAGLIAGTGILHG